MGFENTGKETSCFVCCKINSKRGRASWMPVGSVASQQGIQPHPGPYRPERSLAWGKRSFPSAWPLQDHVWSSVTSFVHPYKQDTEQVSGRGVQDGQGAGAQERPRHLGLFSQEQRRPQGMLRHLFPQLESPNYSCLHREWNSRKTWWSRKYIQVTDRRREEEVTLAGSGRLSKSKGVIAK